MVHSSESRWPWPPIRARPHRHIAVVANGRRHTVGDVLSCAAALADEISTFAQTYKVCRPRIVLPSKEPFAYLVGLLACWKAGAVAATWRNASVDLQVVRGVVNPHGMLETGQPGAFGIAPIAMLEAQSSTDVTEGPRGRPIAEWPSGPPGDVIIMTSGSTGLPKGVALSAESVVANAQLAGSEMGLQTCSGWAIESDCALVSGISHLLMAWQFDLPFYHLAALAVEDWPACFAPGGIGFGGGPIQLVRLGERLGHRANPPVLVSSGDFLTPPMINRIWDMFLDARLHKLYGLTELSGRFCCMPDPLLRERPEPAGFPMPGFAVRLRAAPDATAGNDDGADVGEVEVRSPLLFHGYYRAPGQFEPRTEEWFGTGDRGTISPDGCVTLLGSTNDVFKVGGEKVDRHTLETALIPLLTPCEFCVLPVTHEALGLCPALFIARSSERAYPDWAEIVAHLRGRLPARYIPPFIYALDDGLPYLSSGKVDKQNLIVNHMTFRRITL